MRLIPFEEMSPGFAPTAFQNRMNRLFQEFFGGDGGWSPGEFLPLMDVYDLPEALVVQVDVPGIEAKDIHISYHGDTLTIEGERKQPEEVEKQKVATWFRKERLVGKFTRSVRLPVPVDGEKVDAIDRAGVLTIHLPKLEKAKTRKLPIKLN